MKNVYLIIAIIVFIGFVIKNDTQFQITPHIEVNVQINVDSMNIDSIPKFSSENLKEALISYKIEYDEIVFKQAVLETGYFQSQLFINNNNLFGMMHPSVRETTSLSKKNGYAYYENWIESVKDMALFQDYYSNRISNYKTYYDFLDDIYATDSSYSQKLKQIEYDSI